MNKNIVLIGYMGCGKSSVGKKLAAVNTMNYLDLDAFIEAQEGMLIKQIFESRGEVYFRKIEATYLRACLSDCQNTVLSLGGGTPCFGANMEAILSTAINKSNNTSIYLQTSVTELAKRLFSEKDKRPLIAHTKTVEELTEFVAKHIFERSQYYLKSNLVMNTNSKSIADIVQEINDLLTV